MRFKVLKIYKKNAYQSLMKESSYFIAVKLLYNYLIHVMNLDE